MFTKWQIEKVEKEIESSGWKLRSSPSASHFDFFLYRSSFAPLIKKSRKLFRTSSSSISWRRLSIRFKVALSSLSFLNKGAPVGAGLVGEIFPNLNRISWMSGSPKKAFIFSSSVGFRNWSCWTQVGWETSMKSIRFLMERGWV